MNKETLLKDIKIVLDKEIQWCKDNKSDMPKEYYKAFVAGIKQAKLLLNKLLSIKK